MFLQTIFLTLIFSSLDVSAQYEQCPRDFPEDCECVNTAYGRDIKCITIPLDSWNIKATFDAVSDSINNDSAIIQTVTIDVKLVTQNLEFPAHSVSTLKGKSVDVRTRGKVSRIDPQAFSGSHSTAQSLRVTGMQFSNVSEAFDLVNNFKQLQSVYYVSDTFVSAVPAEAFSADLQSLTAVYIEKAGVVSVGDLAFASLPLIDSIYLLGNNLTLDGISDTAFVVNNAYRSVLLTLEQNSGITHLPQEKFGHFLEGGSNILRVGPSATDDPAYLLYCDERMDWYCTTGSNQVFGYECKEEQYEDIHDYCNQKFKTNA